MKSKTAGNEISEALVVHRTGGILLQSIVQEHCLLFADIRKHLGSLPFTTFARVLLRWGVTYYDRGDKSGVR
nr:hypothetical protein HmN_000407400 [Hymenolepis microstoma]